MDRNARCRQHQLRERRQGGIESLERSSESVRFFNVLTSERLIEMTEALSPEHRERLYTPTVTLSLFIRQALDADGSCQKVVNGWAAQRISDGLSPGSTRTGAYCRARTRLPVTMISGLARETGRQLSGLARPSWRWRDRSVKLVDGTGVSMPDTDQNQARYPQPSTQAAGVGFPLARMVVVICLATGAMIDAAAGPHSGRGNGELGLIRELGAAFEPGDVMLADALYCNYFLIASLVRAGVDVLFEQHGSRITDFTRGRAVGKHDQLIGWRKPRARPEWMTREQYEALPDELWVREVQVGHQVLVTKMMDHRRCDRAALAELYAQRWHVELDLRNLKTTMKMEVLRCHSPEMIDKEIWVHLLAYNVIRLLMAQAAHEASLDPRDLSFKHTVQLCIEWGTRGLAPTACCACLFTLIAQNRVGNRPGRLEPRMRKRRPKPFPWLKQPRPLAREQVRRHGHAHIRRHGHAAASAK